MARSKEAAEEALGDTNVFRNNYWELEGEPEATDAFDFVKRKVKSTEEIISFLTSWKEKHKGKQEILYHPSPSRKKLIVNIKSKI